MQLKTKSFNAQVFLESLCCICFSALMLYLVQSEKYLSYVTPKMKPYLFFTIFVMLVWTLSGLGRLFHPQHKIRSIHCLVLIIPAMLLILPHAALGASDLTLTNPGILENQAETNQSGLQPVNIGRKFSGLDHENKKIVIEDHDFYSWVLELYANMDQYEGYQITLTGSVFRYYERLAEDEFFASRLLMTCCVSDLAPVGLRCQYDQAMELESDSWVTVEGIITLGKFDGYEEPLITVTGISPAEEKGYVYSN